MLVISGPKHAEKFVSQQQVLGNDVRFDNYDIVFFKPAPNAFYSRAGRFRNGQWGYENRFEIGTDGKWRVEGRNVRYPTRTFRN